MRPKPRPHRVPVPRRRTRLRPRAPRPVERTLLDLDPMPRGEDYGAFPPARVALLVVLLCWLAWVLRHR